MAVWFLSLLLEPTETSVPEQHMEIKTGIVRTKLEASKWSAMDGPQGVSFNLLSGMIMPVMVVVVILCFIPRSTSLKMRRYVERELEVAVFCCVQYGNKMCKAADGYKDV